ncbi:MAG: efflux RND transporter periplasmic adaptor subunit [Anaerolineaceae bacterium]|nr:efflux RND transporter periplasmic adaptor subunit [Anaerolineaceae bacterium]
MTLDPSTAPSDIIQATVTLVSAKQALEAAQQSNTARAEAEVTLANAQSAYYTALGNYWNRNTTQGTANNITLYTAKLQLADNKVYELQKYYDTLGEVADNDSGKAQALINLTQAKNDRDTIKSTLDYYKANPDTLDVQSLTAELDLAKAELEDAQRAYDRVKDGPNPDDIASAQAKVDAAQATVNMLSIIAPFDGEVVAIETQEGDQVAEGDSAIIIVNRSMLYVDVQVDETEISRVEIGDTATVTFDALPDITATGKVTFINPVGQSSSGVVNYTVRVQLDESNPDILLGATATVEIDTGAAETLMTVPVAAVQTDSDGNEYVIRVNTDGTTEQVSVVSGTVTGTSVVVKGDLSVGDIVQLSTSSTSTTSSTQESSNIMQLGGSVSGGGGMPSGGAPSGGGPGGN